MRKSYWLLGILLASVVVRVGIALYFGDIVDAPSLLTDQRSVSCSGRQVGGRAWLQLCTGLVPVYAGG